MKRRTVPQSVLVLAERQIGLITRDQCLERGMTERGIRTAVDHGGWRHVVRGVLDTGRTPPGHPMDLRRQRSAWLGALAMGPDAVIVASCAVALHGIHGLPQIIQPSAWLPSGASRPGPPGITVRRWRDPFPTRKLEERRIADVPNALAQAVLELDRLHAIAVLDSAIHLRRISALGLRQVRDLVSGRPGSRRSRDWWGLVDGRSESPVETWARLSCHDAGIPPTALQVTIRNASGELVARADLGWRLPDGQWILVEIDGKEAHDSPKALYRDRKRQNDLVADSRITVLRFTSRDVSEGLVPKEVGPLLTGVKLTSVIGA
ncbi:hypothetical protein IM660_13200 [Ruania alkalisoli]|uniref:DUF559 domain-containing protein n=1 Tax=Ruania alkalisoli TaxID=2779775 RepID=A0A7M1SRL8_9MICO|nr:hypothetical protein [Ruania alkalisoli]QOR69624.1 hypothetical protein IM660_13200 [Ruania alkalisoli]